MATIQVLGGEHLGKKFCRYLVARRISHSVHLGSDVNIQDKNLLSKLHGKYTPTGMSCETTVRTYFKQ